MTTLLTDLLLDHVRCATDLIRCAPYHCTLAAGVCVRRQIAARAPSPTTNSKASRFMRAQINLFGACSACAFGEQLAQQAARTNQEAA